VPPGLGRIFSPTSLRPTSTQANPQQAYCLTEAFALIEETGERWWEAECHRLHGELLLVQASSPGTGPGALQQRAEAETCFCRAIAIARDQEAKSLELRAAMSLSRLWQRQGKRVEARQLLGEVYGWFTEGFVTADLQVSRALLDEVGR
jgi:predicted ATPase